MFLGSARHQNMNTQTKNTSESLIGSSWPIAFSISLQNPTNRATVYENSQLTDALFTENKSPIKYLTRLP